MRGDLAGILRDTVEAYLWIRMARKIVEDRGCVESADQIDGSRICYVFGSMLSAEGDLPVPLVA